MCEYLHCDLIGDKDTPFPSKLQENRNKSVGEGSLCLIFVEFFSLFQTIVGLLFLNKS